MTQTETPSQPKVGLSQDPLDTRLFLSCVADTHTANLRNVSFCPGELKTWAGVLCSPWLFVLKPSHGVAWFWKWVSTTFSFDRAIVQQLSGCIIRSLLICFLHIFPHCA